MSELRASGYCGQEPDDSRAAELSEAGSRAAGKRERMPSARHWARADEIKSADRR